MPPSNQYLHLPPQRWQHSWVLCRRLVRLVFALNLSQKAEKWVVWLLSELYIVCVLWGKVLNLIRCPASTRPGAQGKQRPPQAQYDCCQPSVGAPSALSVTGLDMACGAILASEESLLELLGKFSLLMKKMHRTKHSLVFVWCCCSQNSGSPLTTMKGNQLRSPVSIWGWEGVMEWEWAQVRKALT